ncbi:MAG: TIGR04255 family protein [Candidatus Atribacteria bacterium]|nr:TIGR04255 family protein [Candidatus Atribacteria bacterium]
MTKPIDLKEKFPHLSKAPIVEAALDMRVVPSVKWDETTLPNILKERLSDFPKIETLREARVQIPPPGKEDNPSFEDVCVGFKLYSSDNLNIVQFNKGAYVFSRLKPYKSWGYFSQEALRLWSIYCELLKPTEVRRIGLRFINKISIKQETVEFADYYKYPPESLKDLNWPLNGYLHHDVMRVPETAYSVNLIKTIQNVPGEIGLILDIDVFMQSQFAYDKLRIECLEEMRWVKNKIFFSSLTDKILSELK